MEVELFKYVLFIDLPYTRWKFDSIWDIVDRTIKISHFLVIKTSINVSSTSSDSQKSLILM